LVKIKETHPGAIPLETIANQKKHLCMHITLKNSKSRLLTYTTLFKIQKEEWTFPVSPPFLKSLKVKDTFIIHNSPNEV